MQRRRGFTLIEILVTVTIMVVLMALAVANIRGSQVRARDNDKQNDAENIVRQLDSLYTQGYSFTYSGSPVTLRGSYPTTLHMSDSTARTGIFAGLPPDTLIAAGKTSSDDSITTAINALEDMNLVDPAPSNTYPYVYQPIASNGVLCTDSATQTCRRFNFYYWTEDAGGAKHMIKGINR